MEHLASRGRLRNSMSPTSSALVPGSSHRWAVYNVLGDEPDLRLVGADDLADQQVVGTVVTGFGGFAGHGAGLLEHDLMGVQQPGNLDRYLFAPPGRARDQGDLSDIRCHRHTHA